SRVKGVTTVHSPLSHTGGERAQGCFRGPACPSRRRFLRAAIGLGMTVTGAILLAGCALPPLSQPAGPPLPFVAQQQPVKVPRVGYLGYGSPYPNFWRLGKAFEEGLNELGYVGGRNIVIEYRYADGFTERLPQLLDEFVRLPVDVIVLADA